MVLSHIGVSTLYEWCRLVWENDLEPILYFSSKWTQKCWCTLCVTESMFFHYSNKNVFLVGVLSLCDTSYFTKFSSNVTKFDKWTENSVVPYWIWNQDKPLSMLVYCQFQPFHKYITELFLQKLVSIDILCFIELSFSFYHYFNSTINYLTVYLIFISDLLTLWNETL